MKYTITITKEREEGYNDKFGIRNIYVSDIQLFQAQMDSDETVEILQHLHDLKETRRAQDK